MLVGLQEKESHLKTVYGNGFIPKIKPDKRDLIYDILDSIDLNHGIETKDDNVNSIKAENEETNIENDFHTYKRDIIIENKIKHDNKLNPILDYIELNDLKIQQVKKELELENTIKKMIQ